MAIFQDMDDQYVNPPQSESLPMLYAYHSPFLFVASVKHYNALIVFQKVELVPFKQILVLYLVISVPAAGT